MITTKHILGMAAAITIVSVAALAQGPPQQPVNWERMPRMTLEAEFAGPLRDTTIQRWRDQSADVVCYLYVPFTAQHSAPTASGYVQYGSNSIGTISCVPGRLAGVAAAPKAAAPPAAAKGPPAAAKGPPAAAKGTSRNGSATEEPR
jgi:hypothetical protein